MAFFFVFQFLLVVVENIRLISRDFENANYPGARRSACSSQLGKSFFVFGGEMWPTEFRKLDFWEFNQNLKRWRWIKTNELQMENNAFGKFEGVKQYPGARNGCSMTSHADTGRIFLHGGTGFSREDDFGGDFWSFDTSTMEWAWDLHVSDESIQLGPDFYGEYVSTSKSFPGAREDHAMVTYRNLIFMFGGFGYANEGNKCSDGKMEGDLGDLWEYDITKNEWRWVITSGDSGFDQICKFSGSYDGIIQYPGARSKHSIAIFPDYKTIYLFGGEGFAEIGTKCVLSDMWKYRIDMQSWEWIVGDAAGELEYGSLTSTCNAGTHYANLYPGARSRFTLSSYENYVLLFGGYVGEKNKKGYTAEMWKFDIDTQKWDLSTVHSEQGTLNSTGSLFHHDYYATAFPSTRADLVSEVIQDSFYVFSGECNKRNLNDQGFMTYIGNVWEFKLESSIWKIVTYGENSTMVTLDVDFSSVYGCGAEYFSNSLYGKRSSTTDTEDYPRCCSNEIEPPECNACNFDQSCVGCSDGLSLSSSGKNAVCVDVSFFLKELLSIFLPCLAVGLFCTFLAIIIPIVILLLLVKKREADVEKYSELNEELLPVKFANTKSLFEIPKKHVIKYHLLKKPSLVYDSPGSKVFVCDYYGSKAAIKTLFVRDNEEQYRVKIIQREINIVSSVRHQHIVRFLGFTRFENCIGIVSEWCDGGNLKQFLRRYVEENGKSYPRDGKVRFLHQISTALHFLHESDLLHRGKEESCKLSDFGLACEVFMDVTKTSGVGTSAFISPEVVLGKPYGKAADSYSFGVLILVVITENYRPFNIQHETDLFKRANDPFFNLPDLSVLEDRELNEMVVKNLSYDQDERSDFLAMSKILKRKVNQKQSITIS